MKVALYGKCGVFLGEEPEQYGVIVCEFGYSVWIRVYAADERVPPEKI